MRTWHWLEISLKLPLSAATLCRHNFGLVPRGWGYSNISVQDSGQVRVVTPNTHLHLNLDMVLLPGHIWLLHQLLYSTASLLKKIKSGSKVNCTQSMEKDKALGSCLEREAGTHSKFWCVDDHEAGMVVCKAMTECDNTLQADMLHWNSGCVCWVSASVSL